MKKALILYSSNDGQTLKICERVAKHLSDAKFECTLKDLQALSNFSLVPFDVVVFGAAIRYGKHNPEVKQYIDMHEDELKLKKTALFSVSLLARKPRKAQPAANPYLQKFLRNIGLEPDVIDVFAGKLNYPSYRPFERFFIRLIMFVTGGPTDPKAIVEFTDWQRVEAFSEKVIDLV